jgi:hypothetical protein
MPCLFVEDAKLSNRSWQTCKSMWNYNGIFEKGQEITFGFYSMRYQQRFYYYFEVWMNFFTKLS